MAAPIDNSRAAFNTPPHPIHLPPPLDRRGPPSGAFSPHGPAALSLTAQLSPTAALRPRSAATVEAPPPPLQSVDLARSGGSSGGGGGGGSGHGGPVLSLATSGDRAATGSADCAVHVYDLKQVELKLKLQRSVASPQRLRWRTHRERARHLPSLSYCRSYCLDTLPPQAARVAAFAGHTAAVTCVALQRGGLTSTPKSAVEGGARVLMGHTGRVQSLLLLPPGGGGGDAPLVVSGSKDSQVRLWDASAQRCLVIFAGHDGPVNHLTAVTSNQVLSSSEDGTMRLWQVDACEGRALRLYAGHNGAVTAARVWGAAASASASADGTVRLWDKRVRGAVGVLHGHDDSVTCLEVGPLGSGLLFSGSADSGVIVWDTRATSRRALHVLQGHDGRVNSIRNRHFKGSAWRFLCADAEKAPAVKPAAADGARQPLQPTAANGNQLASDTTRRKSPFKKRLVQMGSSAPPVRQSGMEQSSDKAGSKRPFQDIADEAAAQEQQDDYDEVYNTADAPGGSRKPSKVHRAERGDPGSGEDPGGSEQQVGRMRGGVGWTIPLPTPPTRRQQREMADEPNPLPLTAAPQGGRHTSGSSSSSTQHASPPPSPLACDRSELSLCLSALRGGEDGGSGAAAAYARAAAAAAPCGSLQDALGLDSDSSPQQPLGGSCSSGGGGGSGDDAREDLLFTVSRGLAAVGAARELDAAALEALPEGAVRWLARLLADRAHSVELTTRCMKLQHRDSAYAAAVHKHERDLSRLQVAVREHPAGGSLAVCRDSVFFIASPGAVIIAPQGVTGAPEHMKMQLFMLAVRLEVESESPRSNCIMPCSTAAPGSPVPAKHRCCMCPWPPVARQPDGQDPAQTASCTPLDASNRGNRSRHKRFSSCASALFSAVRHVGHEAICTMQAASSRTESHCAGLPPPPLHVHAPPLRASFKPSAAARCLVLPSQTTVAQQVFREASKGGVAIMELKRQRLRMGKAAVDAHHRLRRSSQRSAHLHTRCTGPICTAHSPLALAFMCFRHAHVARQQQQQQLACRSAHAQRSSGDSTSPADASGTQLHHRCFIVRLQSAERC
ncbi:hypothetical protein JKP88DRAFT_252470 [Tribonema minus]|uniref:Uncharacterized protein n=1 Tax=Tribonema minus TaxID=303371 RepID=A0A835ZF10_9STRA|nr:hypothetical protein JKP88DRAFT_252470 [Tribonema minus]